MSYDFSLKFDPRTIEHLGVKMYSTLPPALSELISNAYDADAGSVKITFHEQNGEPVSIQVQDNGSGMNADDIQNKFLVIGRDRRKKEGDIPSPKYGRLPTGKKGLGKLALFGLADLITIDACKDGKRNRFTLSWNSLINTDGEYHPDTDIVDEDTERKNQTIIKLSSLKRKTPFNIEALADNLSRIFIVDDSFNIILNHTNGKQAYVTNERRYSQIEREFTWSLDDLNMDLGEFGNEVEGVFITAKTPIPPSSGLRGLTIFSRGKLVNAPEFFSNSTSSHFFQYLTGWIKADFIDLLDEDVISTNRQSINWANPEMEEFRKFLAEVVSKLNSRWRSERRKNKEKSLSKETGINRDEWFSTLPNEIRQPAQRIVTALEGEEGIDESYAPVFQALHEIIPEYPHLHWRHLHDRLKTRVDSYYKNSQYGEAADQGAKVYAEILREMSGSPKDGTQIAEVFALKGDEEPLIKVADLETESGKNIQEGQQHMTRGVMRGFRNPINHAPIDSVVPSTFSELDCLNVLSLFSYLITRLDYVGDD
ncbi:uncharacterized protein (TIGR02391 family) [Tamilnaduibacter salinus]|uniref:Uncharacterized protein (TIGR02391 family) n=1 Tax=Tamilnaduibacter salinus TaxID=1484056 RepID=A0A2U1CYK7_9GAMM|nr:TIGR02391 family protein [Tamilnaduibacter salinus]PVY77582.1 uncharacterized protein (TIGR02391 family) [Tamilnaduibacter salinus]